MPKNLQSVIWEVSWLSSFSQSFHLLSICCKDVTFTARDMFRMFLTNSFKLHTCSKCSAVTCCVESLLWAWENVCEKQNVCVGKNVFIVGVFFPVCLLELVIFFFWLKNDTKLFYRVMSFSTLLNHLEAWEMWFKLRASYFWFWWVTKRRAWRFIQPVVFGSCE